MNLVAGISAAGAVLKQATDFVQALKQPKISEETFAEILKAQIEQKQTAAAAVATPEARAAAAGNTATQMMHRFDANLDNRLSLSESGLNAEAFAQLDADGDGYLQHLEIQGYMLKISESSAGHA